MFKKTVILFVSLMLVCMSLATVSSAAETCKVGMDYTVEGDTLTVTVKFSEHNDPDGIVAVDCNIYFDSTVLEYVSNNTVLPEEWGDFAEDWTNLKEDGRLLVAVLCATGETGYGAKGDISLTLEFKILKTGVDTAIDVKNSYLTEDGSLEMIYGANTSLNVSISESGEVSGEVSEDEISLPDEESEVSEESEEVSVPADASTPDEEESKTVADASEDNSASDIGKAEKNNGWVIWVVITVAVAAVAVVVVVVLKKKAK